MTKKLRALNDLCGPSPCSLEWNDLIGNDRIRHCSVCAENVVNLSALTRAEAERLLADPKTGCVHLLRREDETPIFVDRPLFKFQIARLFSWVSILLSFGSGCSNMAQPSSNLLVNEKLKTELKQHESLQKKTEQIQKNSGNVQEELKRPQSNPEQTHKKFHHFMGK